MIHANAKRERERLKSCGFALLQLLKNTRRQNNNKLPASLLCCVHFRFQPNVISINFSQMRKRLAAAALNAGNIENHMAKKRFRRESRESKTMEAQ